MQSDLRDIYHGVHVVEFKNASTKKVSENDQLSDGSGITSVFYLQLSDNYDDMRLLDIFHKYLRNNNYSLGGTDLYSSQALIEEMTATGLCYHNFYCLFNIVDFFQISTNALAQNSMIVRKMLIALICVAHTLVVVKKAMQICRVIQFIRDESVQPN